MGKVYWGVASIYMAVKLLENITNCQVVKLCQIIIRPNSSSTANTVLMMWEFTKRDKCFAVIFTAVIT